MLRKTHVALAGKIFPTLSRLVETLGDGETLRNVFSSLHDAVDLADVFVLMFFGWASVPISRCMYYIFFATKTEARGFPADSFDKTYTYIFSDLFSQVMKVALLVLAADCLDVVLESLGYVSHSSFSCTASLLNFRLRSYQYSSRLDPLYNSHSHRTTCFAALPVPQL